MDLNIIDTSIMDTSIMDTSIMDTSIMDTSIMDTSIMDTSIMDTSIMDTSIMDTSIMDTSLEPCNAGVSSLTRLYSCPCVDFLPLCCINTHLLRHSNSSQVMEEILINHAL